MIHVGDCLETLRTLPDQSAQCCVTSPPYFGLRDYGRDGQIGLEATPDAFVAKLVEVFREVRRALRDDGTLWLNLGDSYCSQGGEYATHVNQVGVGAGQRQWREGAARADGDVRADGNSRRNRNGTVAPGLKPKDLIGIPWRVAFALQADGWYLRQDIIWSKPNPMPESVRDRCTKAHEYLFLLSKSPRYYYDAEAISEEVADSTVERLTQPTLEEQAGSTRVPGKTNGAMKAVGKAYTFNRKTATEGPPGQPAQHREAREEIEYRGRRNKRSVWTVPTMPFREAHFATFPEALIEPCILAGSRPGDMVLDPFGGAGTTGVVAQRLGRQYTLCELNPGYAEIAERRIRNTQPGLELGALA